MYTVTIFDNILVVVPPPSQQLVTKIMTSLVGESYRLPFFPSTTFKGNNPTLTTLYMIFSYIWVSSKRSLT